MKLAKDKVSFKIRLAALLRWVNFSGQRLGWHPWPRPGFICVSKIRLTSLYPEGVEFNIGRRARAGWTRTPETITYLQHVVR